MQESSSLFDQLSLAAACPSFDGLMTQQQLYHSHYQSKKTKTKKQPLSARLIVLPSAALVWSSVTVTWVLPTHCTPLKLLMASEAYMELETHSLGRKKTAAGRASPHVSTGRLESSSGTVCSSTPVYSFKIVDNFFLLFSVVCVCIFFYCIS